jgi:hypothetical protein
MNTKPIRTYFTNRCDAEDKMHKGDKISYRPGYGYYIITYYGEYR